MTHDNPLRNWAESNPKPILTKSKICLTTKTKTSLNQIQNQSENQVQNQS